jgi:peptide/nickel transport system substrate-binding protein
MTDANVRQAAVHAVDKQAIVKRLLRGYGVAIDTLQAPQYAAYDATTKVKYDPELSKQLLAKSGYSVEKPVKFKIQTTRGYLPKDYETVQAIVGMWRKVGIEAEIEVYEIAKHFELRLSHKLAPMAFYNWGDAIGDPNDSTGFAMFGPSPHSGWKSKDVDAMIGPLWGEKDEAKRIAGWKKVDKYIAENALVLPLYQQVQTIVFKKSVAVKPHLAGYLLAQSVTKSAKG